MKVFIDTDFIKEELESAIGDYSGFSVDVEQDMDCYPVATISYQFGGSEGYEWSFNCDIDNGKPVFCVYEDFFERINKENIFAWLFFECIREIDDIKRKNPQSED